MLADGTEAGTAGEKPYSTSEPQTPIKDVTHYNNYYEFGTDKSDPAKYSTKFVTSPWSVSVDGEVNKPGKYDSSVELLKLALPKNGSTGIAAWKRGPS